MRTRLVRTAALTAAATLTVLTAAATLTVLAATPGRAAPAFDDTAQVCAASAKTVEDGLGTFVGELDKVTEAAEHGDLINAEKSVKDAGTSLIALANDLRTHAAEADAATVESTLGSLADEFEAQGKALNGLAALQNFDVTRLDSLADRMVELCGPTPSPSPPPSRSPPPPPPPPPSSSPSSSPG
jgi:soluble cytochrome b562